MKKNRFLVFLLALFMLMTAALPASAEAPSPRYLSKDGNFIYVIKEDGTVEIVDTLLDYRSEINVPTELDGHVVSSVASDVFIRRSSLQRFVVAPDHPHLAAIDWVLFSKADKKLVTYPGYAPTADYSVPQGILTIGDNAFTGSYALKTVTLPDSVTTIGSMAFNGCTEMTGIHIPDSVTAIGEEAFRNCFSLESVRIPEGMTRLENLTFSGCRTLAEIDIPASIAHVGSNPFAGCEKLADIRVAAGHPTLQVLGGVLFHWDGQQAVLVTYPLALAEPAYTAPDGVHFIGDYSFYRNDTLSSITLPEGVTGIGSNAFFDCTALREITLPGSLTSIGSEAFSGCYLLSSVTMPEGVITIGDRAFAECGALESIILPEGVTAIGNEAFFDCMHLSDLTLPASVTFIGEKAFLGCDYDLMLTVTQGSYGESYAIENNIPYTYAGANDWLLD